MENFKKENGINFSIEWLVENGFVENCGDNEYLVLKKFMLKNSVLGNREAIDVFKNEILLVSKTFVVNIFANEAKALHRYCLKIFLCE